MKLTTTTNRDALQSAQSVVFIRWVIASIILFVGFLTPSHAHGTHSSLMAKVDQSLKQKPKDGSLWFQRAMLQFEHEDLAAAAVDFEKAEKFAPGEFAVQWWQGKILAAQGKPLEAKATLDAYLAKIPDHWGALASRARVSMTLKNIPESLEDFRSALKRCPQPGPDLIQEVAQALAANECTDEAVNILETGLNQLGYGSIPPA
ncbi:MAG: tetratricopeptide repeat protein [Akkermansiaceae bacterium]|nr:tetratricopeptide repeat protein [Akkermansiaceae bacterium]